MASANARSERAWTLGSSDGYDRYVRTPGAGKAPGGYAFRTREAALSYVDLFREEAGRYVPYEMILPAPFEDVTTRDVMEAAEARHAWHTAKPDWPRMNGCHICLVEGIDEALGMRGSPRPCLPLRSCHHLLVEADLVNPDTGEAA